MKDEFFRFPQTPHIAWLGEGSPRDDKLLSPDEVQSLLHGSVVVEEKLDGANLGFSVGTDGTLRAQNRGQYLAEPMAGQFRRLSEWLTTHGAALANALGGNLVAFGEWCAARHSVDYTALPDWWLWFDVYDRRVQRFWSTLRRDALAAKLGFTAVPCIERGPQTLDSLKAMVINGHSRYRDGGLEGILVRQEDNDWLLARGKLVHGRFVQSIGEHWRNRALQWNQVAQEGSVRSSHSSG